METEPALLWGIICWLSLSFYYDRMHTHIDFTQQKNLPTTSQLETLKSKYQALYTDRNRQ